MVDYATIQVRASTKKLLESEKRSGESFDDLVRRVLAEAQAVREQTFLNEVHSLLSDRKAMRPLR